MQIKKNKVAIKNIEKSEQLNENLATWPNERLIAYWKCRHKNTYVLYT